MNRILHKLAYFALWITFLLSGDLALGQVLDSHFHLFSAENLEKISDEMISASVSGKDAVALLDAAGAEKAIVLSAAYLLNDPTDARFENYFVQRESEAHSNRLIPFCSVRIGADWAINEIERCFAQMKMRGLKLHPVANSLDLMNDQVWKDLESAVLKVDQLQSRMNRKYPVVIDSNWQNRKITNRIFQLSMKYPKVRIILAHALFIDRMDLELIGFYYQAFPSLPRNLYVDLSATVPFYEGSPDNDKFLWVLRKFGMDRVLFGSDYPVFTPEKALKSLRSYEFSQSEMDGILGNNALGLWN